MPISLISENREAKRIGKQSSRSTTNSWNNAQCGRMMERILHYSKQILTILIVKI